MRLNMRHTKENIISNISVEDPSALVAEHNVLGTNTHLTAEFPHLTHQRCEDTALSAADAPHHGQQFTLGQGEIDLLQRRGVHFPVYRL